MGKAVILLAVFLLAIGALYLTTILIMDNRKLKYYKRITFTIWGQEFKPMVIILYLVMVAFMTIANYSFWHLLGTVSKWR